ncbi:Caspase-8 [Dissostichus eleginoides]|uniref:Caspase-8 n=1 Tax=Dissostichus eleginoides TaxID=100907 RepID=A0AAD9BVR7_DISEL|nr:Caspase-8 [Dissostichus eleginoides]
MVVQIFIISHTGQTYSVALDDTEFKGTTGLDLKHKNEALFRIPVHAADTQDTREESTQCQDGVEKTAGAGCTNAVDVSIDTNLETGVSNYVNDECRRSSDLSNSEDWPIGGYNSPNIQQECNEERKDIRYHLQDDNAEKQRDEGKMIDSDEEAMTGIAEAENQTKKTEILSRETELEESVDNQGKDSARPDGVRHRKSQEVPAAGTQYFREESTPGGYPLSTCETQDQSPAERRKREEDEGTAEEGKYPAATAFINRDNQPQLRKEYELNSQPTGLCLIINNEHFWDGRVRHGTDKDAESLAEVFSWLGFRVLMCKDQTKDQMVRALVCFASQCDLSQLQEFNVKEWTHSRFTDLLVAPQHGDAFICCVLSHGNKGVVLGIDGQPLPIKQITRTFMATRQSPLTAKPKVFLIQACQGGQIHPRVLLNDLEADDSENEEIEVILRSVNNEVAGKEGDLMCGPVKQMPEIRHTLRKGLVLTPHRN